MNRDIKLVIDKLNTVEAVYYYEKETIDRAVIMLETLGNKVAQQEKQIQQLQMALADTEALEAGTAERCCRWRESHKMSQAKVIEKSAVIERLQLAIKAVEIDSDECMDFDECTAMLIPLDTYHQLIEAIPTDSKQILADWMREQLGSPVAWKVSNAVGIGYGDTFQALPEDTDLFKLPDILK